MVSDEKFRAQTGPKQAQMDLHKTEPSCVTVDCFWWEIQSSKTSQTGRNGYTQTKLRNPEFKGVTNRAKWIYTNEAEKSRVQRGPKQAQMDLHKTEALCVDGFWWEIQGSKTSQTGPNGSTQNGAIMCRWFPIRNSEFKEVPNWPKWIYTKRSHHVSL